MAQDTANFYDKLFNHSKILFLCQFKDVLQDVLQYCLRYQLNSKLKNVIYNRQFSFNFIINKGIALDFRYSEKDKESFSWLIVTVIIHRLAFYHGPDLSLAMVMWPPCWKMTQ